MGHIKLILLLYNESKELLKQGIILEDIKDLKIIAEIRRIGNFIPNNEFSEILNLKEKMFNEINSLKLIFGVLEKNEHYL